MALASLVALSVMALAACSDPGPASREVTQAEVSGYASESEPPLLLDVRTAEEYARGHIPGAVNIPHTELKERLAEVGKSDHGVVVYCRSGRRAGIAAEILLGAGIDVGHLEGDMLAWQEAGLPVEVDP